MLVPFCYSLSQFTLSLFSSSSLLSNLMHSIVCCLTTTLTIAITSCGPPPLPEEKVNTPASAPVRAEAYPGNTAPPAPEGIIPQDTSRHPLQALTAQTAGVNITYLSFDTRTHTLAVIDQTGLGSQYQTAAEVTRATGALATINGGFFTPEGQPLGLVYHNGKKAGATNNSSSLGSGVLYIDQKLANPILARRDSIQKWLKDPAFDPKELLQTGPFLIENGRAISGLTNKEPRVRSFLLWDGKHHFAIAQCEPITLRNLAGALATQPLSGFRIELALNLDGGRSADLNISSQVQGGPINLRRWWNKPVRNYLTVKPQ